MPKKIEDLLTVGEEITFSDIEKLLSERSVEEDEETADYLPHLLLKSPLEVSVLHKLKGVIREKTHAEKLPSIRWNFPYGNYVISGTPDGIADDYVYEFKTTQSRFLSLYLKPCAIAQANLYAFFFRRPRWKVQIYIEEEKSILMITSEKDESKVTELLSKFSRADDNNDFLLPKKWKCGSCEIAEKCPHGKINMKKETVNRERILYILTEIVKKKAPPKITPEKKQKFREHMRCRDVLTFLKFLRKTVIFYSQKNFKEVRKYAGLVKREARFLSEKGLLLPVETQSKIKAFLQKTCQHDSEKDITELEGKIRQSIMELLEKSVSQNMFSKFKEELATQDKTYLAPNRRAIGCCTHTHYN